MLEGITLHETSFLSFKDFGNLVEDCRIGIKGNNKWMTLIQNAGYTKEQFNP
jgi:hypothetical protein